MSCFYSNCYARDFSFKLCVFCTTNGCSITADYARLDFDMVEPLDKAHLESELARLVGEAHDVRTVWITDEELDAKPELVRTMSVQPPRGSGSVRTIRIGNTDTLIDLQPCGGTHVVLVTLAEAETVRHAYKDRLLERSAPRMPRRTR